jgi:hypothetical protein
LVNNKISDMEQTAVEWLIKTMVKCDVLPKNTNIDNIVFQQAKQMEQEQRAKIRLEGYGEGYDEGLYDALNK